MRKGEGLSSEGAHLPFKLAQVTRMPCSDAGREQTISDRAPAGAAPGPPPHSSAAMASGAPSETPDYRLKKTGNLGRLGFLAKSCVPSYFLSSPSWLYTPPFPHCTQRNAH